MAWNVFKIFGFIFEYHTPRVVTIKHYKLGIFRLVLQLCILMFIFVFQLWFKKGYQTFSEVEASVTTKVKGVAYSHFFGSEKGSKLSTDQLRIYERVWDVADFVIPPSENNAFFVLTNAVITPNQTRTVCPEDHTEMTDVICNTHARFVPPASNHNQQQGAECVRGRIPYYTSHGSETGRCVRHDRMKTKNDEIHVCEISGWCPVEQDNLLMHDEPLIPNTEFFTVLIKNAINFPRFHAEKYKRNNMPNGVCMFNPGKPETWTCPIFRLGDIVAMAEANYTTLAIRGAVIGIEIRWDCDLDYDFMKYCLPKYNFHVLDDTGWNFRHAIYHEENRRTLFKAYGMKFLIVVGGNAGKFDITRTIVIFITGLGLMGLANILCDFVLLQSSNEYREQIKEKKFEQVKICEGGNKAKTVMDGMGLSRRLTMSLVAKDAALSQSNTFKEHSDALSRTNTIKEQSHSPPLTIETPIGTPAMTCHTHQNNNVNSEIDALVNAL